MRILTLPPQPELRTPRLWLTAFHHADAPAVYAYASDPEVARYVTWPPSESVAESAAFIRGAAGQPETHVWAVREGSGDAPPAGAVEFSLDAPARGAVHYVLARSAWGRGLATEAVRAVLGWAFAAMPELAEVRTTVAVANGASRRVLEKCGFQHVGTETARWPKSLKPVALRVYALARSDWHRGPTIA